MGDALRAANKLNVYGSLEEVQKEWDHVAALVRLTSSKATFRSEALAFFNLVELKRMGKGYDEWLEMMT